MFSLSEQKQALVEQSSRIMATDVSVHLAVAPAEEAIAHAALLACMEWMREVERRLTRFDAQSDLCQLNAAAGRWQPVSEMLFTVAREAVAAAEKSVGLFDPTLLPQLEALGYDRDFSQLSRQASVGPTSASLPDPVSDGSDAPVPAGLPGRQARSGDFNRRRAGCTASQESWRNIQFDARRRAIRLPQGTRLDLGGIAKGWAADMALKRFFRPFANVIVNVGGDLRLRGGPQPGETWAVGIRNPREDHLPTGDNIAIVSMGQGGLATSGATRRWWYQGGQRQHHLLDPRTGRPASLWIPPASDNQEDTNAAQMIATATALAPTAARAEVAAKVALLRGYPAALRAVEAAWTNHSEAEARGPLDESVALLLVLGNGEIVLSANMNEYLATCGAGGAIWA